MVEYMKNVATSTSSTELSVEERNLFLAAFKNVIGARRAAWRIISTIAHKETGKDGTKLDLIKQYRQEVTGNFLLPIYSVFVPSSFSFPIFYM